MKKVNLISLSVLVSFLFTSNVWAQVPAHGSMSVKDAEIWSQTLPAPADPVSVQSTATLDYKVVTMGGTTYVWMGASTGNFWLDGASEIGYTTDDATYSKYGIGINVFGDGNGQAVGSITNEIPAGAKIFMRPQINLTGAAGSNGPNHTIPVAYDPAAKNSAVSATGKPVIAPTRVLEPTSITITFNAAAGDDVFYYVEHPGGADVIFKDDVTYSFAAGASVTYTVYAVDFAGVASDPEIIKTVNESATKLETPVVTVDASKTSLDINPVANASSYLVLVYDEDENVIFQQENYNSGDALRFFLAGNLTISVQAVGDGDTYSSSDFASVPWGVVKGDLDLTVYPPYNGTILFDPAGDGESNATVDYDAAYFDWTTTDDGRIVITIKTHYLVNGTDDQTAWRGVPADRLVVNGEVNTGGQFFTVSTANGDKDLVWTPVAGKTIPYGSEIRWTGNIPYRTISGSHASVFGVAGDEGYVTGNFLNLWPDSAPIFGAVASFIYGAGSGGGTSIANKTFAKSSLFFYPNPAVDVVNFSSKVKEVSVYSLQGQLVLSQQNVDNINVTGLVKGMYIVKAIDNADKQISAKIEIK